MVHGYLATPENDFVNRIYFIHKPLRDLWEMDEGGIPSVWADGRRRGRQARNAVRELQDLCRLLRQTGVGGSDKTIPTSTPSGMSS